VHSWLNSATKNVYSPAAPYTGFAAFYLEGFTRALSDFFLGSTHLSFWGMFGWMNTPLVIGTPEADRIVRFFVQTASWLFLALTLIRLEQVGARLVHAARRGHVRRACQIAFSNLPVNSFFLFTVLMFALYIRLNNRFSAQGRNWLPFVLPIFWVSVAYAPQALRSPTLRALVRCGFFGVLIFYSTVGSAYAIQTIKRAFYPPPDAYERAWREAVLVRCPLGPAKAARALPLQGPRTFAFTSPIDTLNAVEVLVGSSQPPKPGLLTLRLSDETGSPLGVAHANAAQLSGKTNRLFLFDPITGLQGRRLQMVLTYEPMVGDKADGMVVWSSEGGEGFVARLVTMQPGFILTNQARRHEILPPGGQFQVVPVLLADRPYQYSVICPFESLQAIEMRLSTSRQINAGFVTLEVEDEEGRLLSSATVDARHLLDNSWRWFPLLGVSGVKKRLLQIRLTYEVPANAPRAVVGWTGRDEPGVLISRLIGQ
jgi:hypothetical protein